MMRIKSINKASDALLDLYFILRVFDILNWSTRRSDFAFISRMALIEKYKVLIN